ncbi:hypothetical protein [Methanosarcina barkeri]|uniref:hypothetical protein n=1 Tax=Methanosarcina barkeri TaxID=2208 RepID=UPI00064F1DF5|nr:hypothetical protein [Methanosarcina barkeri]
MKIDALENKKLILEEIQKGVSSVPKIAATAGISKGMTYNHLRELKSMGYSRWRKWIHYNGRGKNSIDLILKTRCKNRLGQINQQIPFLAR